MRPTLKSISELLTLKEWLKISKILQEMITRNRPHIWALTPVEPITKIDRLISNHYLVQKKRNLSSSSWIKSKS
jgi:hypothetical protein